MNADRSSDLAVATLSWGMGKSSKQIGGVPASHTHTLVDMALQCGLRAGFTLSQPSPIFIPSDYFREITLEEIFPFAPSHPLEVDLGSGDGSFLVEMAAAHP